MIGRLRRKPKEIEPDRTYSLVHDWTCSECGSRNSHTFSFHDQARAVICGIVCNHCGALVPQAVNLGALPRA